MPIRSTDRSSLRRAASLLLVALAITAVGACRKSGPTDRVRVSGHVEADEVQVAPEVGGRILTLKVAEGDRVSQGDVIATIDTRDTELALVESGVAEVTVTVGMSVASICGCSKWVGWPLQISAARKLRSASSG